MALLSKVPLHIKNKQNGMVLVCVAAMLSTSGCVQPSSYPPVVIYTMPGGSYIQQGQMGFPSAPSAAAGGDVVASSTQKAIAVPASNASSVYDAQPKVPQAIVSPVSLPVQPIEVLPEQGMVSARPSEATASMSLFQRHHLKDELFRYSEGLLDPIAKALEEVMLPALEASACGAAWVPELVEQNTVGMKSKAVSPFASTPHHNVSQCLDVRQVDNWRISPPNQVVFRVLFESSQSHERASRRFNLVLSEGVWRYQMMNEPF